MSKGVAFNVPEDPVPLAGIEDSGVADNNEAVALVLFGGETRVKVHWIDEASGQFTADAPLERPGKK